MHNDLAFILDVDGTITDGTMHYTKDGKQSKVFGPDDWCFLNALRKTMPIHFITGDRKGFAISQRRIEEECNYPLDLVPTDGLERWNWMKQAYPDSKIIFMGDGCKDWYPMYEAHYSITTCDALEHVRNYASYVTKQPGGHRAVAEACVNVIDHFRLPPPEWFPCHWSPEPRGVIANV